MAASQSVTDVEVTSSTWKDDLDSDLDDDLDFTYVPLSLVMIAVSFVANLLVIGITRVEPKLRTPSNRYIRSLAAADLCVTFTTMLPFTLHNMYGAWPFGAVLCTLWICCDFSLCTVSMLHLCFIAHDRYQAIARPVLFTKGQRAKHISREVAAAWILGFVVWSPAVCVTRHALGDAEGQRDDCYYMPDRAYLLTQAAVVYYAPMVAMVWVYLLTMRALKHMDRKWMGYEARNGRRLPTAEDSVAETIDSQWEEASESCESVAQVDEKVMAEGRGRNVKDDGAGKDKVMGDDRNVALARGGVENAAYGGDSSDIGVAITPNEDGAAVAGSSLEVFCMAYRLQRDRGSPKGTEPTNHVIKAEVVTPTKTPTNKSLSKALMRRKKKHEAIVRMIGLVIIAFLICWLPFCIFWPLAAFCESCISDKAYAMSYWLAYLNSALNPILYFLMNGDFRAGFVHLWSRGCHVRVENHRLPSICGCRCST